MTLRKVVIAGLVMAAATVLLGAVSAQETVRILPEQTDEEGGS